MSIFRGSPEAEEARRAHEAAPADTPLPQELSQDWLRRLCLESGGDDAGFVELRRPELGRENDHARRMFPATAILISLVGGGASTRSVDTLSARSCRSADQEVLCGHEGVPA
jgi:hypothetical protein